MPACRGWVSILPAGIIRADRRTGGSRPGGRSQGRILSDVPAAKIAPRDAEVDVE